MDNALPIVEFAFPGPLREKLLDAIRAGEKTTTSSLLREYEVEGEPLPEVGQRGIVVDSEGIARFVVETTAVEVAPLGRVSLAHALSEGEGFSSVEEWRAAHLDFWTSPEVREVIGQDFVVDDDTQVVLETFRMV